MNTNQSCWIKITILRNCKKSTIRCVFNSKKTSRYLHVKKSTTAISSNPSKKSIRKKWTNSSTKCKQTIMIISHRDKHLSRMPNGRKSENKWPDRSTLWLSSLTSKRNYKKVFCKHSIDRRKKIARSLRRKMKLTSLNPLNTSSFSPRTNLYYKWTTIFLSKLYRCKINKLSSKTILEV